MKKTVEAQGPTPGSTKSICCILTLEDGELYVGAWVVRVQDLHVYRGGGGARGRAAVTRHHRHAVPWGKGGYIHYFMGRIIA